MKSKGGQLCDGAHALRDRRGGTWPEGGLEQVLQAEEGSLAHRHLEQHHRGLLRPAHRVRTCLRTLGSFRVQVTQCFLFQPLFSVSSKAVVHSHFSYGVPCSPPTACFSSRKHGRGKRLDASAARAAGSDADSDSDSGPGSPQDCASPGACPFQKRQRQKTHKGSCPCGKRLAELASRLVS